MAIQLIKTGKAVHPVIGVYLDSSYTGEGVRIADEGPNGDPAVNPGGPADAAGLRAGTVWVNCHNVFDAAAPFGGYKKSGYGREMGRHALELYTQTKNVIVNLG